MPASLPLATRHAPRATRHRAGEEIRFNYGSSLPFCPQPDRPLPAAGPAQDEEAPAFSLTRYWSDIEWESLGVDAGVLRAALGELKQAAGQTQPAA